MVDLFKYIKNDGEFPIKRSVNDHKKYRYFKLENGLKVLLIQIAENNTFNNNLTSNQNESLNNNKSKKQKLSDDFDCESSSTNESKDEIEKLCAIAFCVNVGSSSDPEDLNGLCHFTEHVIFMGNEEYPTVNEFDEYIDKHDGYSNGTTEFNYTIYEAQVSNQYLEGCVRRLSACFKKPLFRQENIDTEIYPLHNEFVDSFLSDSTRIEHFLTQLVKKGHIANKFFWGNYKSLVEIPKEKNIDVRQEMVDFFNKYYYSENMSLVIQSQESLDEMDKLVKKYFVDLPFKSDISEIPNVNEISKPNNTIFDDEKDFTNYVKSKNYPFDENVFKNTYYINSIDDGHYLKIYYIFPPLLKYLKDHALHILGVILGHESNNTLISFLRKERLALEILAGSNNNCNFSSNDCYNIFLIEIKLTDEGLKKIDDVVQYVNYYIDLMYNLGINEEIFEEELLIELNQIRFVDETLPLGNVVDLSKNLFIYPPEDLIIGPKFITKYNEKLIKNCLKYIRFQPKIYFIVSKQAFANCVSKVITDKWCDLQYKVIKCKEDWHKLKEIDEKAKNYLKLPAKNEYISTDFTIKKNPSITEPILLEESNCYKFFYKSDNKFLTPKACIFLLFESESLRNDLKKATAMALYYNYLLLYINEYVYAATAANLKYKLELFRGNFKVEVSGFNQKLFKLIQVIMDKLLDFKNIDHDLFSTAKTDLLRCYYNEIIDNENLVNDIISSAVFSGFYTAIEYRKVLKEIELKDVIETVDYFFKSSFLKCFISGNYTEQEAIEIFSYIKNRISFTSDLIDSNNLKIKVRQLPIGENYIYIKAFNKSDENIVVHNYYQIGTTSLKEFMYLSLISVEINDPLFNLLRNQETLAYFLYFNFYYDGDILSYSILVKSLANKFTPIYVNERIEAFLKKFRSDYLEKISLERFQNLVEIKIKIINNPDLNINHETKFYWKQIINSKYRFDIREQKTKILQQMKFENFKLWALETFSNTKIQRKLSICSVGNGLKTEKCFQSIKQSSDDDIINNDDKILSLTYLKLVGELNLFETINDLDAFNSSNKIYN